MKVYIERKLMEKKLMNMAVFHCQAMKKKILFMNCNFFLDSSLVLVFFYYYFVCNFQFFNKDAIVVDYKSNIITNNFSILKTVFPYLYIKNNRKVNGVRGQTPNIVHGLNINLVEALTIKQESHHISLMNKKYFLAYPLRTLSLRS